MKTFKVIINLDDEMVKYNNLCIFVCAKTSERVKEIVKKEYPESQGYIVNILDIYEIENEGLIFSMD